MITAVEFSAAFVACYQEARRRWDLEWQRIWATDPAWSGLMIWEPDAVIRQVAERLELQCFSGEPLHLDAVFHAPGDRWRWFPIRVAVEHENAWPSFDQEVRKLLSVRCPLKVGITYTLSGHVSGDRSRLPALHAMIAGAISREFAAASAVIREDPATEYLFLIGSEEERDQELVWRQLAFRADSGPRDATFKL